MFLSLGLGRVWIGMDEMEPNSLIPEFVNKPSDCRLILICNGAIVQDEDKDLGFNGMMGRQFE